MLEQLLMSLKVLALGFGTVFIALVLLIGVIQLINKVINMEFLNKDKKNQPDNKALDKIEKPKTNLESINSIKNDGDVDDEELIAVITAAIASSLNRSTHDIVVKSVKRIPYRTPAWNRASRNQQFATRL